MNSFSEFETESMGGCESFQFIPAKKVKSLALPVNSIITSAPVLATGFNMLNGLSLKDTLDFEEPSDKSSGGSDTFKTKITGFVPKLTPAMLDLFTEMSIVKYFVVILKDNNGYLRISGHPNAGLIFSFDQATTKTPAGTNGFKFTFSGNFCFPSPFYDPS